MLRRLLHFQEHIQLTYAILYSFYPSLFVLEYTTTVVNNLVFN